MDEHGPVGKSPEESHQDDQMNGEPLLRRLVLKRVWVFHPEKKGFKETLEHLVAEQGYKSTGE